jgi:hypothetical protein
VVTGDAMMGEDGEALPAADARSPASPEPRDVLPEVVNPMLAKEVQKGKLKISRRAEMVVRSALPAGPASSSATDAAPISSPERRPLAAVLAAASPTAASTDGVALEIDSAALVETSAGAASGSRVNFAASAVAE